MTPGTLLARTRLTPLMRAARLILHLSRWRIRGALPDGAHILATAPHTSNADFFLGLLSTRALGTAPRFLAKESLFRFPLGPLMRALGGVPVPRAFPGGTTSRGVQMLLHGEQVAILPKGRRKPGGWRSGVRHLALGSGAPTFLLSLDYGQREITIHGPYTMTRDADADADWFRTHLRNVTGRHPAWTDDVTFLPPKRSA